MTLSGAMRISASGLSAERLRLDVISSNIANANTTSTKTSLPYRRRDVMLSSGEDGVKVDGIVQDQRPFDIKYDPGNDAADKDGNVLASNVQPVNEMVDMMSASRAYEANIAAFNSAKAMIRGALNIGKI